jgi:hypothetical protein
MSLMSPAPIQIDVSKEQNENQGFLAVYDGRVVTAVGSHYWNSICESHGVDDDDKIMVLLDTMGREAKTLI